MKLGLIGCPNSGKTTLFNFLTGSRQKTGNYAGVTVERREGFFKSNEREITLIDLPGAYSLDARTIDESITAKTILNAASINDHLDGFLLIADATQLNRQLYFILQVIEARRLLLDSQTLHNTILVLTMSDALAAQQREINTEHLAQFLGIPVVLISVSKKIGVESLLTWFKTLKTESPNLPPNKNSILDIANISNSEAILKRYQTVEDLIKSVVSKPSQTSVVFDHSSKIDRWLLHPVVGPLFVFACFGFIFQAIFSLAEYPMDLIDAGVAFLQAAVSPTLQNIHPQLQSFVCDGLISGVGSVLIFLPQILILFTFIILLEDSGYMARAAFILDLLMRRMGLPGKSFIPLLSSFACAIPGVMATRTIESKQDRFTTILIAPLMTCSARLPVYTLLIGAFIPHKQLWGFVNMQGFTLFGLYFLGFVTAMLVALILKHTVLKGGESHLILELPNYRLPSVKNLILGLSQRAGLFIKKAGSVILAVSMGLWFLSNYPKTPDPTTNPQLEYSVVGRVGKIIEPAIAPLGFNWKIGIGLITSFMAREVMVSTLATVYSVDDDEPGSNDAPTNEHETLQEHLQADPTFSLAGALALLIFYVYACQCISTLAVIRRETNSLRWPIFVFVYMTILAYVGAWITYRLALMWQ